MTRRKMKVSDLPPESIGSLRTMDDADAAFKRIFSTRQPATIKDIPPRGWAKMRWFADKIFFKEATL
jgi:hypothetical protein